MDNGDVNENNPDKLRKIEWKFSIFIECYKLTKMN